MIDDELIETNPCHVRRGGIYKKAERTKVSGDEVRALADEVPERYKALVLLSAYGSLRVSEVLGRVAKTLIWRTRFLRFGTSFSGSMANGATLSQSHRPAARLSA
jgi:hypothetical protein